MIHHQSESSWSVVRALPIEKSPNSPIKTVLLFALKSHPGVLPGCMFFLGASRHHGVLKALVIFEFVAKPL
jgi:hypothetical protein